MVGFVPVHNGAPCGSDHEPLVPSSCRLRRTRHQWVGEQPETWRMWNDDLPAGGHICLNSTAPCGRTCVDNCW